MKIFYACITLNRLPELAKNLPVIEEHLRPDYYVVIDGGSTDGSVEFLEKFPGMILLVNQFGDFVSQRNLYLDVVEKLAEPGDILVVSDTDEFIQPPTLEILRSVAEQALDEIDCNLIRIRCRSEWTDKTGKVVRATLDDFFKPLIAVWEPGGRYVGAGGTPIHEELFFPSGRRFYDLPDENGTYVYHHVKRIGVTFPRALRNLFFSPYGPDGVRVPYWEDFRDMLIRNGMKTWPEIESRFESGQISDEIKDWLVQHRNDPYSEVKSSFKAFFIWYHPELMPLELRDEYKIDLIEVHLENACQTAPR